MPNIAASAQDCGEAAQPGVGRTADQITRLLARRPGLRVSPRVPAAAGGWSGYAMDIRLADGWTGRCPFADDPVVPLTVSGDPAQFHKARTIAARGTSQRAYVLDGPTGGNVLIFIVDIPGDIKFEGLPRDSGTRHQIPALRRLKENPVKNTALVSLAVVPLAVLATATPAVAYTDSFRGTWTATDSDGSDLVLRIGASGVRGQHAVTEIDNAARVCGGVPAAASGVGDVEGDVMWVRWTIHCTPGGNPFHGPVDEAFVYDLGADTLTDSFGIVFQRA